MKTLQEIRAAIARLSIHEQAMLAGELAAKVPEPGANELNAAIQRGLDDVAAGRVRPIEEARALVREWISKPDPPRI